MRSHRQITAFYAETLVLVLVFVAIILMLTRVFSAAKRDSARAGLLSDAVTLSQNAAEAVSASDSDEALLALLDERDNAFPMGDTAGVTAFYDTQLRPDPEGALRLDVTWLPEETGTGTLVRSVIQVRYRGGEEPIYELETAIFCKEAAP